MKKILIIGTGGTIAARKEGDVLVPGKLTEDEVLAYVPTIRKIADISTCSLFNIDSSDIQPEYWVKISQKIYESQKDYDGVVVIHGTDTMHYSASALSFLLQNLPFPVVFTGAQVPPQHIGSDASRNLLDAVRVATETDIHECVIVFNGKIIRGNRANKMREVEFDAFESIGMAPLGIIEHDIRLTGEHITNTGKPLVLATTLDKNVQTLKIHPGFDPSLITYLVDKGYRALIIEGFGAGNVPIHEHSLLETITYATEKNTAIILSTQCAIGYSWVYLYENGKKALEAGAIPSHDIITETALTKMMWILGKTDDLNEIKKLFLTNICGEIRKLDSPKDKIFTQML